MTSTPTTNASPTARGGADAHPHRVRGWLLALGGMLMVSTDSTFIRWADTDSWTLVALLGAFSSVALTVYAAVSTRAAPWKVLHGFAVPAVLIAITSAGSMIFFTNAVNNSSIANVVAIIGATPAVAAIMGTVILRERVSKLMGLAIVGTSIGVLIVVSSSLGTPNIIGDLFALGAVLSFCMSIIVWRRHPTMSRPYALAAASATMMLIALPHADPAHITPRVVTAAALMGLVFNVGGRIMYTSAPRFAPTAEVGLFVPVETVAAGVWAWAFFDELPTTRAIVGTLVILVCIVIGTMSTNSATAG